MAITVTSEQKCNELPEVTTPDSSYSFVAFEDGSNAGAKINYSKLADAILTKIAEQEYTIGGEQVTLIDAISALQTLSTKQETAMTNVSLGSYCQLWDNSVSFKNLNKNRNGSVYRYFASTGAELSGAPQSYADITGNVAGYRQEFTQVDSGNVKYSVVQLYEILPNPGRIWTNTYNNGTWSNWRASSSKLIDNGRTAEVHVEPQSYADINVSYNFPFPYTPTVQVAFGSSPDYYGLGYCAVALIGNTVTTTGFTARVFNAGNSPRNIKVAWYAIG